MIGVSVWLKMEECIEYLNKLVRMGFFKLCVFFGLETIVAFFNRHMEFLKKGASCCLPLNELSSVRFTVIAFLLVFRGQYFRVSNVSISVDARGFHKCETVQCQDITPNYAQGCHYKNSFTLFRRFWWGQKTCDTFSQKKLWPLFGFSECSAVLYTQFFCSDMSFAYLMLDAFCFQLDGKVEKDMKPRDTPKMALYFFMETQSSQRLWHVLHWKDSGFIS